MIAYSDTQDEDVMTPEQEADLAAYYAATEAADYAAWVEASETYS